MVHLGLEVNVTGGKNVRTLEILLEQTVPGDARPMELAAHAPVSVLVSAIVDELQLPQTDLLGNPLVYMLRYAPTGPMLPEDKSLFAVGIHPGTKLALDSYVVNGSVGTLLQKGQGTRQPAFYASDTMADYNAFPTLDVHTSGSMLAMPLRKKNRWSRRAFLLLGGVVLGAGTVGAGYAAYHSLLMGAGKTQLVKTTPAPLKTPAHLNVTPRPFTPPTSARAALVFMQHQQTVRAVAWSPDGKMLASGANDNLLLTWNLDGMVQGQQQQPGSVRAVAWSPDGLWLATGSANRVALFNVANGFAQQQVMDTHQQAVTTLAWSPQQPLRLLSGSDDMQAIVWTMPAFTQQTDFMRHTAPILSASWASDNQTVATSSQGGVIRVWNASSGQEVHGYYLDAQLPMRALAFAPTGSMLAVGGDDGLVRLWSELTCQQDQQGQFGNQCMDAPQRLAAHTGIARALAWSPDGHLLATGGDDGTLAIWYPAQSQTPLLRVHLDAPVLSLAWSPSGKQVATASGNNVTLWGLY
jgi:WD domain, G-beta repeat/Anaphase-promoting complex subunit 4 WD40 domain